MVNRWFDGVRMGSGSVDAITVSGEGLAMADAVALGGTRPGALLSTFARRLVRPVALA